MVLVLFATAFPGSVSAGTVDRAPLDRMWDDAMLEGRSLVYNGRTASPSPFHSSYTEAFGSPLGVSTSAEGIYVEDLSGTRLVLWRVGGWFLRGGPLQKVAVGNLTLELYGKEVVKRAPILILNLPALVSHAPPDTLVEYQFFLLLRRSDSEPARLLRKWVISRGEVMFTNGDESRHAAGALSYDRKTKTATVEVQGLKDPFEERVDLANTLP